MLAFRRSYTLVVFFVSLVMTSAAFASAQPHMTPTRFGLVSLGAGQTARMTVTISNPDLLPAGATMTTTVTFDIYEGSTVPDAPDRPVMFRLVSHQSAAITLRAGEAASVEYTVPREHAAVRVSGMQVPDNPDFRTTGALVPAILPVFEVRDANTTLFLNPAQ